MKGMLQALKALSERLKTARETAFQIPESARQIDSVWYAGMAIRPADFSQQLSSLQLSLKRESSPANTSETTKPLVV
jgi:hypothetical protein